MLSAELCPHRTAPFYSLCPIAQRRGGLAGPGTARAGQGESDS